jgi:hypothetical protein
LFRQQSVKCSVVFILRDNVIASDFDVLVIVFNL